MLKLLLIILIVLGNFLPVLFLSFYVENLRQFFELQVMNIYYGWNYAGFARKILKEKK